jgi:hypothetical protein
MLAKVKVKVNQSLKKDLFDKFDITFFPIIFCKFYVLAIFKKYKKDYFFFSSF